MSVGVVVGNPKPRSRTFAAACLVAEKLSGAPADVVYDLADFGPALLDGSDPAVTEAIKTIAATDLVVFASPTYKGSFTGLLKLFLDRIGGGALSAVTAVPVMLGADWRHALAPEIFLKPVLAELGASSPTRGLFLLDTEVSESDALTAWLQLARRQLAHALPERAGVA